jgi:hypothetical protein
MHFLQSTDWKADRREEGKPNRLKKPGQVISEKSEVRGVDCTRLHSYGVCNGSPLRKSLLERASLVFFANAMLVSHAL